MQRARPCTGDERERARAASPHPPPLGRRVVVVGNTAAGKSTLARALAAHLGVPHIELDALHWEPCWTPTPPERFRARVEAATAAEGWVADGNYGPVRDLLWARAETIAWLDYPFATLLLRLTRRTLHRTLRRERLWGTNQETLWRHLATRDSLYWWLATTFRRRRRELSAAIRGSEYPQLRWVRLRSPRATERWLAALGERDCAG